MANVDYVKSAIAAGVGVVDEVLEAQDDRNGRTEPLKRWSGMSRLGGALLGYGLQVFMPRQARIGEALALASTPLLVKSLAGTTIRGAVNKSKSSYIPRRRVPVGAEAGGFVETPGQDGGYRWS